MGVLYKNIDFVERKELLLFKTLVSWVKLRFVDSMNIAFDAKTLPLIREIQAVDQMKKPGMISDEDAWIIEKNALLFSVATRAFLHDFLPKQLFDSYGEAKFSSNRKGSVVDIALLPIKLGPAVINEVAPCTMYIAKKSEVVKKFKETNSFSPSSHVDIIPLIKTNLSVFLTKEERKNIEKYYHKYKANPDIIKAKEEIIKRKLIEDKNLKSVLRAINSQGKRTSILKLAITIYTLVKNMYQTVPHNISKIKFEGNGGSPVPDFSRLFYIEYDVDLEQVKTILEPLVDPDLKIKLGNNRILFTTASGLNPDSDNEMENVVSAKIINEKGLNHLFETHVGPMALIDDVNKIMDKFLQNKYRQEYS